MRKEELRIGNLYNSVKFNTVVRCELSDFAQLEAMCCGAELDSDIIEQVFEPIKITQRFIKDNGLDKSHFLSKK